MGIEVKKELEEYLRNKRYLKRKEEQIDRLEEQIKKVTAIYSDMPKGGANSKEDLIVMKLDLERELCTYLKSLLEQQKIIENTLQKLDARYRNILDFLYIEGMTLVEVAAEENYSYRQAKRLLKEAYKQYAEVRSE